MKMIAVISSRLSVHFLLVAFGIIWSSLLYSADDLLGFFVKFQKNELSVYGHGVVQTKDGGFLVTGGLHDVEGPHTWGWLAKVGHKGNREWQKELGKKAQDSIFNAAVSTRHGEILLAGSVRGHYEYGFEQASAWLVKINQEGEVLWDKVLVIGRAARAVDIKLLDADNVLVLVTTEQGSKDFISVLKFNPSGKEISRKDVSPPDSVIGKFIYPLPDNGFIVSGTKFSPPDFQNKVWIARFSENGRVLWDQTLHDRQGKPSAGVVLPDNDVLFATLDGLGVGLRGTQLSLVRVGKSGNLLWNKKISGSEICSISTLWVSDKGKILAAGTNCDSERARVWVGEVLDNGEIKLLKEMASINGAEIVHGLPFDKKIVIVLEGKAGSGDTPTWLLVDSMREIE